MNSDISIQNQHNVNKLEIPPGYVHFINGGYASIYYNSNINSILKIQPLYDDIRPESLSTSTLYESIIQAAIIDIPNTIKLDKIEIYNNSHIVHYMPYYGISFHDYFKFIKNNTANTANTANTPTLKLKHPLLIILSVAETCFALFKKGIQHTDLKPTNILINVNNNSKNGSPERR